MNPQTAKRASRSRGPGRRGPTTQITSAAHQAASLDTPRANFRLARGLGVAPRNLRLARGLDAPSGESPPRSRARRPLGRISSSLEVAPSSRPPHPLPDHSIKCSGTTRAPGSKGESSPRRPSDTARESYLGVVPPTLLVRPYRPLHQRCAGRPVSTP
jgi:hypothetical protein